MVGPSGSTSKTSTNSWPLATEGRWVADACVSPCAAFSTCPSSIYAGASDESVAPRGTEAQGDPQRLRRGELPGVRCQAHPQVRPRRRHVFESTNLLDQQGTRPRRMDLQDAVRDGRGKRALSQVPGEGAKSTPQV